MSIRLSDDRRPLLVIQLCTGVTALNIFWNILTQRLPIGELSSKCFNEASVAFTTFHLGTGLRVCGRRRSDPSARSG
jgi:hypothetical protein